MARLEPGHAVDRVSTITVLVVSSPGPRRVDRQTLSLPQGATLGAATHALQALWGDALLGLTVALWGRQRPAAWRLQDGDRIELLRPLQVDPMESRRRRQALQKQRKLKLAVRAKTNVPATVGCDHPATSPKPGS
jgi:uncharacterized protein